MILPYIDPVALQIGPLEIRWYGLSWLLAFMSIYILAKKKLAIINDQQLSDLMFYGLLGAIVGGRSGYMLFYGIDALIQNPLSLFYIWQGGLSFHGGFLGVLVSIYFLAKSWNLGFFTITDFISPFIPIGLGFVRIGNFLNSELLGRPTDAYWGVVFPSDPLGLIRHPSQIYQAFSEGLVLSVILFWFSKPSKPRGVISSLFLIGYGVIRFITEFFREPDVHIGFDLLNLITRGQILSIPMVIVGVIMMYYFIKKDLDKNATIP